MNRTLAFVMILLLAVVVAAGVQVARPVPGVELRAAATQPKVLGQFAVSFPKQGQAAVGEASLGLVAKTPNQEPVAIASLTKMMTAYLLVQAQPLKKGEDGPTSTITAADLQEYLKDKKNGDSVVKVAVGEKLTERQLLEALLLPSADNIATLIANKLAGNEAGFVKQMNAAAHNLGMSQTTYTDAAGVNPATVSTAQDQLRVAQELMKNATLREVVSLPQSELPVAGLVYNVNFMVGKQGISGVKTGSTLAAGSCFVGSYPIVVNGTPRILLGAVLGQQSLHEALTYDTKMLHLVAPQFNDYPVPAPRDGFARLATAWGQQSSLKVAKQLHVFGYPGMPITLAAKLTQASLPITPGQTVGNLTVTAGDLTQTVGLQAAQAIQAPDMLWRLHR